MKATRDSSGNLLVTSAETFVSVLLLLCVTGAIAIWFAPIRSSGAAGWTGVFAIFGLALLAANERSRFFFDRGRAVLIWRKDTPFRHESGEIDFAAITALSLERDFNSGGRRGGARRLVLHTKNGPLPVTTAYTGIGNAAQRVGESICAYLDEVAPIHERPFITD